MALCGIAAAVLGVSCGPVIPISITVPITLGTGFTIPDLGILEPGADIPSDFGSIPIPICILPTRDDIRNVIAQIDGGLLASLIQIDSVDLIETKFTATNGDFNDLTHLGLFWQASPVQGVPQPEIDLGDVVSASGLGLEVVLVPPQPVDFLAIMDNEAGNPPGECPTLGIEIGGKVPEVVAVWDVGITARITGKIGL
jgi:hypothetical protein